MGLHGLLQGYLYFLLYYEGAKAGVKKQGIKT
jgi:hypothetical protein